MFALNPINVDRPPRHTQVQIQCCTCDKANVCVLQPDYRKTATLIQNILGDPQLDRELVPDCGFSGLDFEDLTIFPSTIVFRRNEEDFTGNLLSAKYINENKVKVLYDVNKYFVMIVLVYSESFDRFEVVECKELYYGILYEVPQDQVELLIANLPAWREELIEKEEQDKGDIINTTYFSCILRCAEYRQNKPVRPPHCENKDDPYYHIGTFHKEDKPVQEYHNYNPPIAYPVFIEPRHKKPARRRDDT